MKNEYIKTMIQLATTAFGLVAALAWNEAINSLFISIFGEAGNIWSLFIYAAAITLIVVLITTRLAKLAAKVGIEAEDK